MRSTMLAAAAGCLVLAAVVASSPAADHGGSCTSCTSCTGPCLEPRCSGSWAETKTKKPVYSLKCEYACDRGCDPWHAPDPECRCGPPCGKVYVKKRFYKTDGEEKVERVPKYEVEMVAARPCGCVACRKSCWDPLGLLWLFQYR